MRVSPDYVLNTVQYSITSAIAGDILGRTLNQYCPSERVEILDVWLKKPKNSFPKDKLVPENTGKGSVNLDWFMRHFTLLIELDPYSTTHKNTL